MNVVIGIDPHKASHTAVAIDEPEDELSGVKVRATRRQVEQLLSWAEPGPPNRPVGWATCWPSSSSPEARRSSTCQRPWPLASGCSPRALEQERPNDARSVAIAAFRAPNLRSVEAAHHCEVLRLLAKRYWDLGSHRTRVICRLHVLLAELAPGGTAKELYVSGAEELMAKITPTTPAEQVRYDLAHELLDDDRRLGAQTKESHRRIRTAVKASGTSLTDVYGVGPTIAAQIIGYAGHVGRFANRDVFASYNGTATIEWSSGGRVVHRLSRRGNRRLNHALHMAAIAQIRNPGTDGLIYFERKVTEGKTKKEALRSLKRQISNAVYRQLLLDFEKGPGGH